MRLTLCESMHSTSNLNGIGHHLLNVQNGKDSKGTNTEVTLGNMRSSCMTTKIVVCAVGIH